MIIHYEINVKLSQLTFAESHFGIELCIKYLQKTS